jgi:hypothetical protein
VALCRLLLKQPDVLLLDEPTNHLDAESVLWLEQHLAQYSGTVIAVTHDRYFLDNVAGWILELDRGEGIPWKGNYSSWLDQKSTRMAQEEKVASKRRKNLERELDWVRQGAKGRQTKQKARLQNYDKLLNEDQKQLDEKLEIYIPNGPRLGTNVIEAKNVAKAFGEKLLYDNLNFTLPQAGIVGIIGPRQHHLGAVGQNGHRGFAGAFLGQGPGVALVIDLGGPGAGRARASGAVVLAGHRDAVALDAVGSGSRGCDTDGADGCGEGGEDQGFVGHGNITPCCCAGLAL